MSKSDPSPSCPRCHAPLRAQVVFCADCGSPVIPLSAPGSEAAPTASQETPGGWITGPPGYQPYRQAGPSGFPAAPVAAPPKPRNTSLMLRIIAVVVLVGGGAASWFLYFSPNHSNSPFYNRHGLPDSVPLPAGLVNFTPIKDFHVYGAQGATVNVQGWAWGVESTTPAQLVQFYQDHLPGKGWTHLKTLTTLQGGMKSVYACQGSMLLIIDADAKSLAFADDHGHLSSTVTAPSEGSVLGILLLTGNLSLMDTDCAAAA